MTSDRTIALLCLDFDGVICDSIDECMLVAFNAYSGSARTELVAFPVEHRETFRRFRYLVRDPGEYYILVDRIYRNQVISEKLFSVALKEEFAACANFKPKFFAARRALQESNMRNWLGLHRPFQPFVDFIKEAKVPMDVITTKDEESVDMLLREYGVRTCIQSIFGQKSLAVRGGKAGALQHTCRERDIRSTETAYIDDHLQHLLDMQSTGAVLWYATWGYSSPSSVEIPADVHVAKLDGVRNILQRI